VLQKNDRNAADGKLETHQLQQEMAALKAQMVGPLQLLEHL